MTGKEAKRICDSCPMKTWNPPEKLNSPFGSFTIIPGFYTCGKLGVKVKGESCGCVITLKTIFKKLTDCPQNKWASKESQND